MVVVLGSSLLALAALEGACRLAPTRQVYYRLLLSSQGSMVRPHPSWLYANRPGFRGEFNSRLFRTSVRINGQGLRERPIPYEREGRETRGLVLGDSFAFGWGVAAEETVSRALEARLPGVRTLNAGCIGWGTGQQTRFLAEEGWRYDPDWVVLYFFGNDPVETLTWEQRQAARERAPAAPPAAPPQNLASRCEQFLFRRSAAWIELARGVNLLTDAAGDPRPARAAAWAAETRALTALNADCRARGVPLLVAQIPDVGLGPRPDGTPVPSPWHAPLQELCERERIPLVDLYPPLAAASRRQNVHFPIDGHWTSFGHQVAAQATARRIRTLGWLDARRLASVTRAGY